MALCLGAVLGPLMGLMLAPFAVFPLVGGAACALMSIVLACVQVQDSSPPPIPETAKAHSPSTGDA